MQVQLIDKGNLDAVLDDVANIHASAYSAGHFTSNFSFEKLKEYNRNLIENSDMTLVAKDGERVVGFLISGVAVSQGVKKFTQNNRLYLIWMLLGRPWTLVNKVAGMLHTLLLPVQPSSAKYRLLSIATRPGSQSHGVGKLLMESLERELRKHGVSSFGLSVKKKNVRAVKFYKENGFELESEHLGSLYFRRDLGGLS